MASLISILINCLIALCGIYAGLIFFFYRGLKRLASGANATPHSVIIAVAARNEADHVEQCITSLLEQDYPPDKFSIHVIDDHSTDATAAIVQRYVDRHPQRVWLHKAGERAGTISPKINALQEAIRKTDSDLILTTDADCFAVKNWVSTMVSYFETNVGVVSGITRFKKTEAVNTILHGVQFLDFVSITACGAGAIGNNRTIICNGSNLAFRRAAFNDVGGYSSFAHHGNGDDSFLAQEIEATGKWTVRFVCSPSSFVTTFPVTQWSDFFRQRMRWGSQPAYYDFSRVLLLSATFLFYIGLFVITPVALWFGIFTPLLIAAVKSGIDFLFVRSFLSKTGLRHLLVYFVPAAIIHIPSVLFGVLAGYFFSYRWKERSLKGISTR